MFKPTEEDVKFIYDNYGEIPTREISIILGCSTSYVKKIGLERKTKLAKEYMEEKYSPNKEYYNLIRRP